MENWNDPKTVINQNVPVETQNKLLIEKMLDNQTIVESPMANLLIHEGNAELLMSYLTRNSNNTDNLITKRPIEATLEMKRAYQVVQLFIQSTKPFAIFISLRITNIIKSLFQIFRKDSVGSLYHWKAVFEVLLQNHPAKLVSILCENVAFLENFFEFIDEDPVSDCLIEFLSSNKLIITDRKVLFSKFNEIKFIQRIISDKFLQNNQDYGGISNFLVSLFRKLMLVQTSAMLFNNLSKTSYPMIEKLFQSFPEKELSEEQKKWIAFFIKNVFTLCKQETLETPANQEKFQAPQKINNYLMPFLDTFVTQAKNNLTHLLDSLVLTNHLGREDDVQSDTFTEYRLYLLQILAFLVTEEDLSVLSKFPLPLWKSLVKWFFMHPNNNIYHSIFYKIWRATITFNNEPVFRNLFSKCKLVMRLVTHYEQNPTSPLNGFVLLICNTIRFTSSLPQTNKFFADYINSNQQFSKFVPLLIEQTSKQVTPYSSNNIRLPFPHTQPFQTDKNFVSINEKIENNKQIELGSLYAHLIGYNQPPIKNESENKVENTVDNIEAIENEVDKIVDDINNITPQKK